MIYSALVKFFWKMFCFFANTKKVQPRLRDREGGRVPRRGKVFCVRGQSVVGIDEEEEKEDLMGY